MHTLTQMPVGVYVYIIIIIICSNSSSSSRNPLIPKGLGILQMLLQSCSFEQYSRCQTTAIPLCKRILSHFPRVAVPATKTQSHNKSVFLPSRSRSAVVYHGQQKTRQESPSKWVFEEFINSMLFVVSHGNQNCILRNL